MEINPLDLHVTLVEVTGVVSWETKAFQELERKLEKIGKTL